MPAAALGSAAPRTRSNQSDDTTPQRPVPNVFGLNGRQPPNGYTACGVRGELPPPIETPYVTKRSPKLVNFWGGIRSLCFLIKLGIPVGHSKEGFYLLIACGLSLFVGVADGLWPLILQQLGDAVSRLDWETVVWFLIGIFFYNVLKASLKATMNWIVMKLLARMRRNIIKVFHDKYMESESKLFYVLNDLDKRLDNCDGRITNDLEVISERFCKHLYRYLKVRLFKLPIRLLR